MGHSIKGRNSTTAGGGINADRQGLSSIGDVDRVKGPTSEALKVVIPGKFNIWWEVTVGRDLGLHYGMKMWQSASQGSLVLYISEGLKTSRSPTIWWIR